MSCLYVCLVSSVPRLQEHNWQSGLAEPKQGETGGKGRQQCLPLHPLRPHLLRLLHHRPHGEIHQEGARGDSLWKLLCRVCREKMVRINKNISTMYISCFLQLGWCLGRGFRFFYLVYQPRLDRALSLFQQPWQYSDCWQSGSLQFFVHGVPLGFPLHCLLLEGHFQWPVSITSQSSKMAGSQGSPVFEILGLLRMTQSTKAFSDEVGESSRTWWLVLWQKLILVFICLIGDV